jgi:integrase
MPPVAYAQFRREVLQLYQPPFRRKSTHAKMSKVLDEFGRLPGVKRTSDITPMAIFDWLAAHDHRRPITNKTYLGAFRAAVNIAVKLQYLRVSPWAIRTDWVAFDDEDDDRSLAVRAARHCSIEQIVGLLDLLDAEAIRGGWAECPLQALVYTYALTGMRKSEALGLRVADADLPGRVIRLKGHRVRRLKTKSSTRLIAIHPELATVLYLWVARVDSEWLFPGVRLKSPWLSGSRGAKASLVS